METVGYVGTVEVETSGTDRLWFGLTESKGHTADWIKIGPVRAWFKGALRFSAWVGRCR